MIADSGGMTWDDTPNVCGAAAQAAEAMAEPQDAQPQDAQPMPTPEVADTVGQPLTRPDCDRAGMTWNDTANDVGQNRSCRQVHLSRKKRTRLRPPSSSA